jgi:cellulose biosynthesis protein BcsQ
MKIVSIINHKGGVGKTTFTGSIAQALALSGFRALAVDNDSQHNLSTLLGVGVLSPSIANVYRSTPREAPEQLLRSIRKTEIENLHAITAPGDLRNADVGERQSLKQAIAACDLAHYYDFVLIDNAPGLDALQIASILASDEIFVPTELHQFAIDGITEMEKALQRELPQAPPISKIIPNFYRDTKRHNSFVAALHEMFPRRVTETAIPVDPVFDELVTESKILFLHRLYSKGAAFYLKLMHELFSLSEDDLWEQLVEKRRERLSEDARQRFFERQRQQMPDNTEMQ